MLQSPLALKVHTAFAAAAGKALNNGTVDGLVVTTDPNTNLFDLDLFASPAIELKVNEHWVSTTDPEALTTSLLVGMESTLY